MLAGQATWDDVGGALVEHAAELRRFTTEQRVQTNEVQRAWALLPGFLTVSDGRPLDVLELGPSAGLNLIWDRYRYRYSTGSWGQGDFVLEGDDRTPPPAELLVRDVSVVRRRGVDLNPVEATSEHGARVLQAFVWADQTARLERLRRAIDALRADPPELIRGDYVDSLPPLLADWVDGAQPVVFQTASTMYLSEADLARLRTALEHAARVEPIMFLSSGVHDKGFALELERYPGGSVERLAVFDFHGAWLEWGR